MKIKIKKKIILIITVIIIFVILILASLFLYNNYNEAKIEKEKTIALMEENTKFVYDVIKAVDKIFESRKLLGDLGNSLSSQRTTIFTMKEKIEDAEYIINKWRYANDNKIVTIENFDLFFTDFNDGLDNILKKLETGDNYSFDLGMVKLNEAIESIVLLTSDIVLGSNTLLLQGQQKASIVEYINRFEWYKKYSNLSLEAKEKGEFESFIAPEEYWALTILQNSLLKSYSQ